jgi:hypothetical protein
MKKYEVRGWYRYADNEKDFIYEEITADSQQMVISIFTQTHKRNFFSIDIKLVS